MQAMEGDRGRPAAGSRARPLLTAAFVAASGLAVFVAVPYALLWTLFWVASGSWDVEGSSGLRYWLLVEGSRLDRLGLVAPTAHPASYSVRFQEGTFPGWRVVSYASSAAPGAIIATYAGRCSATGLRVKTRETPSANSDADAGQATLVCEIEPYIDAEFHAERNVPATATSVSVRVWGSR